MKGSIKLLTGLSVLSACIALCTVDLYAGTGIYVGKDASAEGTTIIGASAEEDVGTAVIPVIIEKGSLAKGDVIKEANGYEYTLPEDNAKVTLNRLMSYAGYGDWNTMATNEYGVSVIASVMTLVNDKAVEADTFVNAGVCEDKVPLILTATAKNAKEAVELLTSLYEKDGADNAEITLIADQNEAWVVESFTGHQYAAVKLPTDVTGVFGAEPVIRTVNPDDADTICSEGLLTLPVDKEFAVYDDDKNIDLVLTYGSDNNIEESHFVVWLGHNLFAPSEGLEFDAATAYDVFFKPDEKVSIDRVFALFRNRYEETPFDLKDDKNLKTYYGINNQFVGNVGIAQIFGDVPAALSTVIWSTPSNPTASPFIPVPAVADALPAAFSTDVAEDAYEDGIVQFDFAKLNNRVIPRRELYGASIRQYWEGQELLSATDITKLVNNEWKSAYEASPEDAAKAADDFLAGIVDVADSNCTRLLGEFDWYLYRYGQMRPDIPDDELSPFVCSFDPVSYAVAGGWDTKVEGNVFTATRDGKTIEIILDGNDKGKVSLSGFDANSLAEELMGGGDPSAEDEIMLALDGEEVDGDLVIEADEEADEAGEAAEETEEAAAEEAAPAKEEAAEAAVEETAEPEETTVEEVVEADKADAGKEPEKKETAAVTKKLEVDTISALENYFGEKITEIPRDGWAENDIASELAGVANDVAGILAQYYTDDIEQLLGTEYYEKVGADLVSNPDLAAAGDRLALAGIDLSGLLTNYFNSLAGDVAGDLENGRLTQEGAEKILLEAQSDVEAIATIYIRAAESAFNGIVDYLSQDEVKELIDELGAAAEVLDEYGLINLDSVGLGDVDLSKLTDSDINVVITLSEMDDSVIDGLSALLGVDARATLDEYVKAINASGYTINTGK